jgi:SAM-dependent methyltransferase
MTTFSALKSRIFQYLAKLRKIRKVSKIRKILADPSPPDTTASERDFNLLQSSYPSNRGSLYKYDEFSLFERAAHRCLNLLRMDELQTPGSKILDIGAGDGVLGYLLSAYGHEVTLTDKEDWRSRLGKKLAFTEADTNRGLPFANSTFDLVISYNSFEHLPNPEHAFLETLRVTRPGGLVLLDFGPLYCSPWGLHAYRSLYMPYSQFLLSENFTIQKLSEIGIHDLGRDRTELQFLNRWRWSSFHDLWQSNECTMLEQRGYEDASHLDLILRYPKAFTGRKLSLDDLIKSNVSVLFRTSNATKNDVEPKSDQVP